MRSARPRCAALKRCNHNSIVFTPIRSGGRSPLVDHVRVPLQQRQVVGAHTPHPSHHTGERGSRGGRGAAAIWLCRCILSARNSVGGSRCVRRVRYSRPRRNCGAYSGEPRPQGSIDDATVVGKIRRDEGEVLMPPSADGVNVSW